MTKHWKVVNNRYTNIVNLLTTMEALVLNAKLPRGTYWTPISPSQDSSLTKSKSAKIIEFPKKKK